jgi:hypothetical protein
VRALRVRLCVLLSVRGARAYSCTAPPAEAEAHAFELRSDAATGVGLKLLRAQLLLTPEWNSGAAREAQARACAQNRVPWDGGVVIARVDAARRTRRARAGCRVRGGGRRAGAGGRAARQAGAVVEEGARAAPGARVAIPLGPVVRRARCV